MGSKEECQHSVGHLDNLRVPLTDDEAISGGRQFHVDVRADCRKCGSLIKLDTVIKRREVVNDGER